MRRQLCQGNNYPTTASRGAGNRIPVIRGWEGTLTIEKNEIVFIPARGSKKKPQRFAIEHGEDFVEYWQNFLDCWLYNIADNKHRYAKSRCTVLMFLLNQRCLNVCFSPKGR